VLSNRALMAESLQTPDAADVAKLQSAMAANREVIGSTWKAYDATYMEADERALANAFARLYGRYLIEADTPVQDALREGNQQLARSQYQHAVAPAMPALLDGLQKLSKLQTAVSRQLYEDAQQRESVLIPLFVASILLGVAIAGGFSYALARNLLNQLGAEPGEVLTVVKSVAAGDLASPIQCAGQQHSVMGGLRAMQKSLQDIVGSVREGSETVASASAQIAAGNHDLSARTEQQAAALQQTSAAMTQLGSAVNQNASAAQEASTLATGASQVAERGGAVVAQVVEKMRNINDSSKKIADITSVIDSIAFQTNILALNAAVEAARAGEEGRGFAVVAAEVRNLAGRSAEAAKEIKTLIQSSVERVEQGSALVDQAGDTMRQVVDSIQQVADLISSISAATAEGATGVSQVGEAMVQMDNGVQQNAALVEEMAAAASALRAQANGLVDKVSVFNLGHLALDGTFKPELLLGPTQVRNPLSSNKAPNGQERRGNARPLFAD
jgi:methyl-accepting chemotaxis protein